MTTIKTTVYVEILPEHRAYSPNIYNARVGNTWKRRPNPEQVTPGAIVVKVDMEIPTDRLRHVVTAIIPSAEAIR